MLAPLSFQAIVLTIHIHQLHTCMDNTRCTCVPFGRKAYSSRLFVNPWLGGAAWNSTTSSGASSSALSVGLPEHV